jgi:hypothetical protein
MKKYLGKAKPRVVTGPKAGQWANLAITSEQLVGKIADRPGR